MTRKLYTQAIANREHAGSNGVAVVGSFQTIPSTDRPYKVRGVAFTNKTKHTVEIALTIDEARKLVDDLVSQR